MSTEVTARAFFARPYFAVVGASQNQAKFGYKIFAWYTSHGLPATPIHPSLPAVRVDGADHKTLPSITALPQPRQTALSVVTPPAVTLQVLREARRLGIGAVWLQPGTYDDAVLEFARGMSDGSVDAAAAPNFEAVVAGGGGRGPEGWCVLVDGERALLANGKL